jgi:hypothetical protein
MKSKRYLLLMLVAVVGLLMASCGPSKQVTATAAVQAAESAYENVKLELMKYVPDQTQGIEDAIAGAKASLEKRKYKEALAAAQGIPDRVKALAATAAANKDAWTKGWAAAGDGIPGMLQAIRAKLTIYSIPEEVPKNLAKTKLLACRKSYEEAVSLWEEAKNSSSGAGLPHAIAKADTARDKAVEIMKTLGIKAPAAPAKG